MSDIEKARRLFREAALRFPTIPKLLAASMKEQCNWCFSTRELKVSPYNLQHYVQESDTAIEDYAVLCHTAHAVNSCAIQYYLVYGPLRMFLHLGWGGTYIDARAATSNIRICFSLADKIVPVATMAAEKLTTCERLTIVASNFYGSYWFASGQARHKVKASSKSPVALMTEVLHWLESCSPHSRCIRPGEIVP
jgi:hypothetical protein